MARKPSPQASPKSPQERKAASIALLRQHNIPVLESAPPIESEEEAGRRTEDELRAQVLALSMLFMRARFAATHQPHDAFLSAFEPLRADAEENLSEHQLGFVDDPNPAEDAITDGLWTIESLAALLWAAGLVKSLPWPDTVADPATLEPHIEAALSGRPLSLRPTADLLDQMDLHHRLLWAVVNHKLDGPNPAANGSIIYERTRALGWLTQPDVGWETVDMST
jgi:hypothetical protein